MIHVEYEKKNNYPHDRKIILFDRSGFQHIHRDILAEINKRYNILCPQIFVMECIAPNNTDGKSGEELEKNKKSLREKLELIENSIVFTGETYRSPVIDVPNRAHYLSILMSEEIAANCITSTPITMERVSSEKLISHYEPRINVFKGYIKEQTEKCEAIKGTLSQKNLITYVQELVKQDHNRIPSKQEVKKALRRNERTGVKVNPRYAAEAILRAMEDEPIIDNVNRLSRAGWLPLTDEETEILYSQIQEGKTLTVENYPHLSYPIYIYYLFRYIVHGRQFNTIHLDQSYVQDFRYLHYLNFCDMFITNEKSTPYIIRALPYSDIKNIFIMTSEELRESLS